jgi:anion transporter
MRKESMNPITITLLFLVFAVVMFAWEKIPLGLTSVIICVGFILTGVLDAPTAFSGFVNPTVILFVALFVIGGALFETGVAGDIGGFVTKFANGERSLIIAIMLITGLLSSVLSNTGTAAVLIPVAIGISSKSGIARSKLLMPVAFASTMGGMFTLISTPANMIGQDALADLGLSFGFFEFSKIGLPIFICGVLYFAFIAYKFLPDNQRKLTLDLSQRDDDVPTWKKIGAVLILILTVVGMIFEQQLGFPVHVIGAIGAISVVLFRVINDQQAYRSIDLQTIFLFGGTLSLEAALDSTGAGQLIADTVIGLLGQNASPIVLTMVMFLITVLLTNFMSNTATAALLIPISISIALGMGIDPRMMVMATIIGTSCTYATPISTPANVMILKPGGYKFVDFMKIGLPLILITTVLMLILMPIFYG